MDVRKREHAFQNLYKEFCAIQNSQVLHRVNIHVHTGVLDFFGDGIKDNEWRPLLKALNLDRCLHFIAVRSKAVPRPITPAPNDLKTSSDPKFLGTGISRSILVKLLVTLRNNLSLNKNLTHLELDGLHLTLDSLQILSAGLGRSTSLRSLSLRRCRTGDRGCQLICTALRNHPTINSVDFSACDLSEKGALFVAHLLQYQNLNRYNENWKQSLRYREPNMEAMPGLRRITLSHNNIGDVGAQYILQILHDDRWIKAVDLQNCNLSEEIGQKFLRLFRANDTIAILDVRNNKTMLPNTVAEIIIELTSRRSQFEWLSDDPVCVPRTNSQTTVNVTGLKKPNMTGTQVRKAISNIFPAGNNATKVPRTSGVHNRPTSVAGSTSQMETLQRHLEQLTKQLEEEIAKRKAAEATRDKAQSRLESHLREMAETREATNGRVLIDKGVLQQVNSAFSDLNQFLSVIRSAGLGQYLKFPKPSYQGSRDTSYSSGIRCYDDRPTSSEFNEMKSKEIDSFEARYSYPNAGQGDCLSSSEVQDANPMTANDQEDDSSTLKNSYSDEERKECDSVSDESDPSWATIPSGTSIPVS